MTILPRRLRDLDLCLINTFEYHTIESASTTATIVVHTAGVIP